MTAERGAALYRLMTWLSPSFPVGAFSYSSGIEWAVEAGDITDAASLARLAGGDAGGRSGFCDGVFLAQAHRAASARDEPRLREIAELAAAFVPSRERQLETTTQGRAFIEIARAAWSCDGLDQMVAACGGAIVYPVAVGVVSAAHAIPLAPAHARLPACAGVELDFRRRRLVPLGQTDSQRVLAALEPVVVATASARAGSFARRSRQRHFSRRSRQPAPRDAIHAAVPVMNVRMLIVVPAKAGTHNHRVRGCGSGTTFVIGSAVWVPAFAGTTTEEHRHV